MDETTTLVSLLQNAKGTGITQHWMLGSKIPIIHVRRKWAY